MKIRLPKGVSRETAALKHPNLEFWRAPPRLKISEWARNYRILSKKDSARAGRWRSDPHQDEIMDAFCDRRVWKVVLMAASQIVGKSQMMNNVLGYYMDVDPSNVMMVFPTVADAEKWSKGRLDPLIETTKRLEGKIRKRVGRDSENTIFHRNFRGGQLFAVGSNAPSGLSAQSVRIMVADEVDRYEASAGQEGDPLELAEQRTETYWNRKVAHVSTPLIAGLSRIEASYEESDKRVYECKCPGCKQYFVIEFENIEWGKIEGKKGPERHLTDTAHVQCPLCKRHWNETDRQKAIEDGQWQPTGDFRGIAGFRINAFACKRANIPRIAARWIRAKGSLEREKAFRNLVEARTFIERGDAPDHDRLYERREPYQRGIVPVGGLVLTIGVDVQRDRLEIEIVAWGRGLESWSIDYRVIPGDPSYDSTWDELTKVMAETFPQENGGELKIARVVVDSGFESHAVYNWRRRTSDARIIVIKGWDKLPTAIGRPNWVEINYRGKVIQHGVQLWPVGTSFLKNELYSWLRLPVPELGVPTPGYCHFPMYDKEHFEQLTAETLLTHMVKGYPRRVWTKTRIRNEALDARCYARAAAAQIGLDRWNDTHWNRLEALVSSVGDEPQPAHSDAPAAPPGGRSTGESLDAEAEARQARRAGPDRKGGWLSRDTRRWLK